MNISDITRLGDTDKQCIIPAPALRRVDASVPFNMEKFTKEKDELLIERRHQNILSSIIFQVATWEENKKYCSILFDEVALEAALTYDKHKDNIIGFVDLTERTNEFADHALIFLLRGAIHKWQQPLAFYFCKGATSGIQMKKIIKDVVAAVTNTGLLPVALVSDQGTSFQSALKSLQEDTRREQILAGHKIAICGRVESEASAQRHRRERATMSLLRARSEFAAFAPKTPYCVDFRIISLRPRGEIVTRSKRTRCALASLSNDVITINGHTLSVIYDPPHLIKGLRNNFLTKNIKYNGKVSKWSDIVEVYKTDCIHADARFLHKLCDEHVKNCVKVFSKTMAALLAFTAQFSQYTDGNEISPTLTNTSEIVSFLDDLFDSVNGATLYSKKNKGKPLRHAVTEKSPNHKFWQEAIKKLEEIRYIDSSGKETSVPSLKNWVVTLKSYQRLWQFFKSKNIKIMRPRYFNSDPIEIFFGQVRAYNFRNNDPNCHSFKSTFRSLLITRFTQFHSESYNCEEDSGEQLLKLKALFETNKNAMQHSANITGSPESSDAENQVVAGIPGSAGEERLKIHSRAYSTGWVVRKILNKIKCRQCETNLTSAESNLEKNGINNWISFREFKSIKDRKLTYPSEYAVRLFGDITKFTNDYLEDNPQRKDILKYIKKMHE
ncbi:hypothetical protein MSG28_004268 [Choristoneura fumiferana]|uniref:Uncharacterized protein n=1 Tax=Choristoneura fumiferana TaxID=7141 RepID=A0ACC0KIB3_CHOFU|nr:hypothetical protein MSG28_004268 [Choristoneura fumiferana]